VGSSAFASARQERHQHQHQCKFQDQARVPAAAKFRSRWHCSGAAHCVTGDPPPAPQFFVSRHKQFLKNETATLWART
jgi:hypothetical protein